VYLVGAIALNARFLGLAIAMRREPHRRSLPMKTFRYSITYLAVLFLLLLIDHYGSLVALAVSGG
jgi:protoheme IX farnesyltransferase